MLPALSIAAGLLTATGCAPEPEPVIEAGPLDDSWVAQVVSDPSQFTAALGDARAAWAALHRSDLAAAASAGGPAGVRAEVALADLHGDLAQLSALAWSATAETWEARTGLPEGSAISWFVGLAVLESGDAQRAAAWLTRASDADEAAVRQAASALLDVGGLGPVDAGDNPLLRRYSAHLAARAPGGDPAPLVASATRPVHSEAARGGLERVFYDPQIHWTLADAWRPERGALPADLQGLLFSPCLTADDLAADRARQDGGGAPGSQCARAESWSALGLDTSPGADDDAERARALVRSLDKVLDPWAARLAESATPEGRELLEGLRLVPVLRSQALLSLARQALEAEHPRQALAFAQLALDFENPRDLSPINAPGLFAVLAEANLRTGHTREALDALQVLVEVFPETAAVDEVVGDLAILQAMDRHGDSKEN